MKRLQRFRAIIPLLALAILPIVAACSDSTGPRVSAAGTWNLKTVNGANLPFTFFSDGTTTMEVTSDVITVSEGGAFTELTTFRTTENGSATTDTQAEAGHYTLSGNNVTFTYNDGSFFGTGTISGNTLTISETGLSLVYEKQ